ncbi:MAG TPA: PKD domain-containing protein [Candidatus Nanoarchaeia archaeon]|nr:PKD domain-containing protein [Candidatus Nanoarchaeia archaeon]
MKFNSFYSATMKVLFAILIVFVLCGFLVIAQDQEIQNSQDSSSSTSSNSENIIDSSSASLASDSEVVLSNEEIYVNIDELPILPVENSFVGNDTDMNVQIVENVSSLENTQNSSEVIDVNQTDSSNSEEVVIKASNSLNKVNNSLDNSDYDYVDLKDILDEYQKLQEKQINISLESKDLEEDKEIAYVLYEGNKKEIETLTAEGTGLVINVDETVTEEPNWEKEVSISSNQHHENPVTAYSDISEDENSGKIVVFWKEEQKNLDYETFDTNNNGIVDRISWVVPHLSTQNFLITLDESNSSNVSGQILLTSPASNFNVNSSSVVLPFLVNNTLEAVTSCNFSLFKYGILNVSYISTSSVVNYNVSVDNGNYSWNFNCTDSVNNLFNYSLGNFVVSINNTPKITFTSNVSAALKNSTVGFTVVVNASTSPILYTIDWNDGSAIFNSSYIGASYVSNTLSHLYNSSGTYNVKLTAVVANVSYEKIISVTIVSIGSVVDNTDPSIILIYPEEGDELTGSTINFTYFAKDNIYVSNCTLSVYYYKNNSPLGVLIHSQVDKTVNNKNTSVYLDDLSSGSYSWDIGCYDNSSNYYDQDASFELSNSNVYATYSEPELNLNSADQLMLNDVNNLLEKINNFITKEDSYGLKEKEAIADLGLDDKINGYKKILIQNKLDISYNLGFMRDETLREKRKSEIRENLLEMEREVPLDLSVSDDYDYYKTESKVDIENVAKEILSLNRMSVSPGTLNSIVSYLQNLQGNAVISNNAKQVSLVYDDKTEEITLVRKSIELKNNSLDYFVEKVPEEVSTSEVVFLTKSKSLGDQYYQIQAADFNGESIVYYIKDSIELNEVEKTSTLLFSEDSLTIKQSAGITGFVTSFSINDYVSVWPYLLGFLFISIILFGGAYYTKQTGVVRMAEQNTEFRIVMDKLESASRFIKLKDFESAKSEYRNIKEKYSLLPEEARIVAYKKIKDLQIDLDRKEAIELVKEFILSVQQGRKEDARLIYNKIKVVYPRLPEEDRKKGYDKIAPYLSLLNSR